MDVEEDSELSSSSSSYSSSGEESVGEEEDEDSEEEAPPGPKGTERQDKGRRKRKRKLVGRRRELRSKYESVKDFNPEARSAQSEEIERIRRLELQRSLQAANPTISRIASVCEDDTEPAALLGRGPVFHNLAEDEKRERVVDAIVISSDSEEEEEEGGVGREEEEVRGAAGGRVRGVESGREVKKEEGRGGRYDMMGEGEGEQVVVNMGHLPGEDDVLLAPQIARIIKPHQVGGVRFLYDNLIESLSRFHTSTGFGCILAHSMGLGKTLQVIAFIDIFFRHTPAKHVLCVVPVNTLQNWVVEFDKWLPDKEKEEQRKNGGPPAKTSRSRNKRSQQNGRLSSKTTDLLQPPNNVPSVITKNTVSMPTVAMDTSNNLQFPDGLLSEADQQLLMSLASDNCRQLPSFSLSPGEKLVSTPPGGLMPGSSFSTPESHSHTPTPSIADSRSHTASPNTLDIQYRNFRLFVLSESYRNMESRLRVIRQWRHEGGVLLIGYEMYRILSLSVPSLGGNKMAVKRRKTAKLQQDNSFVDLEENEREMEKLMEIQSALCAPGPDLVVCDEGHRIKNDYTNISQALKKIHTRRRVVLTGYPLQNNLLEYWCMVDFVRPKYLGTKQEFCDLFERPISNGQCVDSTAKDVRTMRYRSHVLHTLLKGFVLRRGHEILKWSLPDKFEHVLLVRPSPVQAALYDFNMHNLQQGGTSTTAGPLKAFAVCTKIWNHPDIYYNEATKVQEPKKNSPMTWQDDIGLPKSVLPKTETNKVEWPKEALSMLPPYETGRLDNSPKMVVTMEILDRSVQLGDKLLIFSQSLLSLSYIEGLLVRRPIPIPHSAGPAGEVQYSGKLWTKNVNFCRLDGSTGSADRDRLITFFNSPANTEMWVFLLSTKAGCLGINLIGANRVIVLDVSWNPCYDAQAVCRVYRYGQTKPCHIYRLVCDGTMERKIYDRQISKQGMADRVVDELQPERHFTADEIITLMRPLAVLPAPQDFSFSSAKFMFDQVLYILCQHFGPVLTKLPFKHESLLLDSANEKMTEVEKYYAMRGFQQDWNARKRNTAPQVSIQRHTPVSPQPRQAGVPSPVATPTLAPPPAPPSSSLHLSPYSNTRVGLPSSSVPIPNHLNYSMQSHSSTNVAPLQYSHSSIPSSSGDMGYGNVTTPVISNHNDVICLDSDNELDWNQITSQTRSDTMAPDMMPSQATLLPGPKVLTVPISSPTLGPAYSSPGSTHFAMGNPSPTTSAVDSPPLNAAVAQLMALLKQRETGGGGGGGGGETNNREGSVPSNYLPPSSQMNLITNTPYSMHSHVSTLPSARTQSYSMGHQLNSMGQQSPIMGHQLNSMGQQSPIMGHQLNSMGQQSPIMGRQSPVMGQHSPIMGQPSPVMGQQLNSMGQQSSGLAHRQNFEDGGGHTTSNNIAANSGQNVGHPTFQSGQTLSTLDWTTSPLHPSTVCTDVSRYSTAIPPQTSATSTNSSSTNLPAYSSLLSSLLQPSNNDTSLQQLEYHHQVDATPLSQPSPAQPLLPISSFSHTVNPSCAASQLANSTHLTVSASSLPNTAPMGVSQSNSSGHIAHDMLQSPSCPLFSPPKFPFSREAPQAPFSHSLTHGTRAPSHPSHTISSQSHLPSQSPPTPSLPSPHPPSSSLPCSPSTALTPSPLSQPPTPSTSIPLLSPVAAHFFQVSMSKSPKTSSSPSNTPTPSPSSSHHHRPLTSPPLCSPPSVSMATSPATKNTTVHSSDTSGFHSNNHDNSLVW